VCPSGRLVSLKSARLDDQCRDLASAVAAAVAASALQSDKRVASRKLNLESDPPNLLHLHRHEKSGLLLPKSLQQSPGRSSRNPGRALVPPVEPLLFRSPISGNCSEAHVRSQLVLPLSLNQDRSRECPETKPSPKNRSLQK